MKSFTFSVSVPVLLVALAGTGFMMPVVLQNLGRVAVSYTTSSTVSLREPIFIDFSIHNGLAHPIKFDLGKSRKTKFRLTVTEPNASAVQLPPLSDEGFGSTGRMLLEPGQTYSQNLLLNEWYDFGHVGNYKVEVRLADPIVTESGKNVDESTSGILSLEIRPRNPELLKGRCQDLVKQVIGAQAYADAAEAALALSHVRDSLAVPYLEKALLANQLVEPIAIAGLERIGDGQAVQALISALKIQTGDTGDLARAALERIEKMTGDSRIKERIRQLQR